MFHRISDLNQIDGPTLCKFSSRLFAYAGVMQARLRDEENKRSKTADGQPREFVSDAEAKRLVQDEGVFETVSADG